MSINCRPSVLLNFLLIYSRSGDIIIIISVAPITSKSRLIIREDHLAKFCCTRKIITSWLKMNDISVLSNGIPRKVGITETYRYPLIMKLRNHAFLISLCADSTATINCVFYQLYLANFDH